MSQLSSLIPLKYVLFLQEPANLKMLESFVYLPVGIIAQKVSKSSENQTLQ